MIRYTVYADDYPAGHRATLEEARKLVEELRARGVVPTRIVERERAYPFTALHTHKP